MKHLRIQLSLLAGVAIAAVTEQRLAVAEAVRVPIRTANTRTAQLDPDNLPTPVPLSPTPIPQSPTPGLPPSVGTPLPPEPTPDQPIPSYQAPPTPRGGGSVLYPGPLGADFQRDDIPKKAYPGDGGRPPASKPLPISPAPLTNGAISGPIAGTDRYGIAPPPGTLGQTYQRRSRMIDDDKHPRMAGVDVHLSENYDVSAKGLKAKWTGKVWHLSTESLHPGIPHIYEVKAEWGPEDAKQSQTRSVRLIMNRIVDLEF